jgi:photosystem II stability/assembly factor-like uncharacterized protein
MRIKLIVNCLGILLATAISTFARPIDTTHLALAIQSAPLVFEPNHGQQRAAVRFFSRASEYSLSLMSGKAVLQSTNNRDSVMIQFVGSNRSAAIEGANLLQSKTHYLNDLNPSKWHKDIPNYSRVQYRNLYPGIDLVFYGDHRDVEYDFLLAPSANPSALRLRVAGARVEIDENGDLLFHMSSGTFRQRKPRIYQEKDGGRTVIAGGYAMDHGDIVFRTESYDRSRKLVIDPVLSYATALVNPNGEGSLFTPIAVDSSGYVYTVAAPNLIVKMSISGDGTATTVYSTLVGSNTSEIRGLAVDPFGNVYVVGHSNPGTPGVPVVPVFNGFRSACDCLFIAKLNSSGSSILYSTYTGPNPGQYRPGIAVDSNGNFYLAASTSDTSYPIKNAYQTTIHGNSDMVISKVDTTLSGDASLIYSTFYGGTLADVPWAITVDSAGNVYATGATQSSDFPLMYPLQAVYGGPPNPPDQGGDVFILKLDPSGMPLYSTYLGGAGNDVGTGIAVDSGQNIYLAGTTSSPDFPIHNGFQTSFGGGNDQTSFSGLGDAFAAKISADGATLLYSSYLGGAGTDQAFGVAIDGAGDLYVAGTTYSRDFPQLNPIHGVGALQTTDGGGTWSVAGIGLPFSNRAVAIDPRQTTRVYIGGDQGLFRSADGASTWTGTAVTLPVRAIAFDSTVTPSIVFAATNGGVFKSTNGGDTWTTQNSGLGSLDIGNIIVTPGHLVFAYSRTGLYKSANGGASWTLASSYVFDFETTQNLTGEFGKPGLAYDLNSPSTIYALNSQGFISKSTDGGSTWNALQLLVDGSDFVKLIAISGNGAIYATVWSDSDGQYLIFKSVDGGATWSPTGACYGIAADAMAFDSANPAVLYTVDTYGVYKSTDGCVTLSRLEFGTRFFRDVAVVPSEPSHILVATYLTEPAAFVSKIDPSKSGAASLLYSSYYGAIGGTGGDAIAVDSSGNAFIAGFVGNHPSVYCPNCTDVTNPDGTLTLRNSNHSTDTLLFKVGGLVVTTPSNPVAQSGSVTTTFSNVTTDGTTSITTIDPALAGQAPGQLAISNVAAFEISTTASVTGPIVSCFVVNSVNDAATFASLRVLHSELVGSTYQLVDRTILPPNFDTRTVCAQTTSLSPFYIMRTGQRLVPLFDQTKAYKGATLPLKVRLLNSSGANSSSSAVPLTIRNIRLLGSATLANTEDAGNANPDLTFRYDASLGGYVYNLSLKNYPPGRYGISIFVGSDRSFFYTVEFQVQ